MADEPTIVDAVTPNSSAPQPEYEFTATQNQVFSGLSGNLGFLGWFIIIVVVAFHAVVLGRWAIQGVPPDDRFRLTHVLWPLLLLLCASQFITAARSFRRVAETQGSDIRHLMDGLGGLNTAFEWLSIIPKVWVFVAVIAAVVGGILGLIHLAGY
ncbi:MAG TPA: hypothetical protein VM533_08535 [Fimbriiglobus sp.]|jgi:hypothetical protein|nr:hypothetical protein [Fimbriiglobus sp.]